MLNHFSNISQICVKNSSSWKNKIFLTFDIDWAHDEIIEDCLQLVVSSGASSTWFVTHHFDLLKSLSNQSSVELGIHPNFNNLLFNTSTKTSESIIESILNVVPNAKSLRSHSLTQNERLIDLFHKFGLSHISNFFIPHTTNTSIVPFNLWDDMVVVPHYWQDNVSIKMNIGFPDEDINSIQLRVYNFHPIHVFLNTNNLNLYENTREIHSNPKELIKYRYHGTGIRTYLINLLELAKNNENSSNRTF